MKSKVYFVEKKEDLGKLRKTIPELKSPVAIKTHFGEKGNVTFPNPVIVSFFSDSVKDKKACLIECNVLYKGERTFASTHQKLAKEHGFNFLPIDICDGEKGDEEIEIKIDEKHFKKAKVGSGVDKYNSILSVAHFKGHGACGFGGAIKNIGMGLASRAGKLEIHSRIMPSIETEKCIGCRACVDCCPVNAIILNKNNKAEIDSKKCIGCAKCISVCSKKAVKIPWRGTTNVEFEERLAEYCKAILKNKKTYFVNLLVDITEGCDCVGKKMKPFMKDIGFLASKDPVAIDQASFDLVKNTYGKDPFREKWHVNSEHQLEYAEKINLGTRDYELVKL